MCSEGVVCSGGEGCIVRSGGVRDGDDWHESCSGRVGVLICDGGVS